MPSSFPGAFQVYECRTRWFTRALRQGLYRQEINRKALRLLLGQIGMGETQFLVRALCRWDGLELRLFLSEILIQLTPLW